jgi:hypothetical protein
MTDIIEKLRLLDRGYVDVTIHEHWDKTHWLFDNNIYALAYGGAVGMYAQNDGFGWEDLVRENQEEFARHMEQLGLVGSGIVFLRVPITYEFGEPGLDISNAESVTFLEDGVEVPPRKKPSEAALAIAEIERLRADNARLRKLLDEPNT